MHYSRLIIIIIFLNTILLTSYIAINFSSFLQLKPSVTGPSLVSQPKKSTFVCSLRGEKWIVVTSIFYPTVSIHKFLNLTTEWNLIVIGDRKTPKDWESRLTIKSARVLFLSIEQQKTLNYRILDYLPEGSYARKNIGYLVAIACGARVIFESDDDNQLDTDDIHILPKISQPQHIPWIGFRRQRSLLINIYGSFGHSQIWPRGFPVDQLRNVTEDGWHSVRRNEESHTHAYIQQFLADLDPDVDALYRLTHPLSIGRIRFDQNQPPIALEPFTFSPYNTQNTITHYEAFWGLYLPVTTTFRVCDIWRGFWVQRLLWDIGGRLVFGKATVNQVRNSHSYLADMVEEEQLYHQSGSFVRFLNSWSSTLPSLPQRISQLARDIADGKFWRATEVEIIDAWLSDLQSVNYSFPPIASHSASPERKEKRAAVCLTGCAEQSWSETESSIRRYLSNDVDLFLFLSSSADRSHSESWNRLKQIRAYTNSTVTILYEDRVLDLPALSNCTTTSPTNLETGRRIRYSQQLWALSQCYDLVREYEKKMAIRYERLIQAKFGVLFVKNPLALKIPDDSTIIISDDDLSENYNDIFAMGSLSSMEKYMKRWNHFKACDFHHSPNAISFKRTMDKLGVSLHLEKNLFLIRTYSKLDGCHGHNSSIRTLV